MLDTKKLLTKILQKLAFTPVTLSSTKVECTAVGTSYEYTTISDIADYNIIGVNFVVHEASQMVYFVRGTNPDVSLIDVPAAGRFRGTVKADWTNSRIGIRCIAAPNNRYDLVYFQGVYGIA